MLELGAGTGLVSIAALKTRVASRALATDLAENLALLHANARLNGLDADALAIAPLDWREPPSAVLRAFHYDVVLAADCVFWPSLFAPLLDALATASDLRPDCRLFVTRPLSLSLSPAPRFSLWEYANTSDEAPA